MFYPKLNKLEKVRCIEFMDKFDQAPTDQEIFLRGQIEIYNEENTVHEPVKGIVEENRNESRARCPTRTRNKPSYLSEYIVDDVTHVSYTVDNCYKIVNMPDIPTNYQQAEKSPEASK